LVRETLPLGKREFVQFPQKRPRRRLQPAAIPPIIQTLDLLFWTTIHQFKNCIVGLSAENVVNASLLGNTVEDMADDRAKDRNRDIRSGGLDGSANGQIPIQARQSGASDDQCTAR
jgi:hypothetical protein